MAKMHQPADLLQRAHELAEHARSWADLSNALYDPFIGLLARALPTKEERAAFVKTEEYRQINELLVRAQERFGLVEGATPKDLGPFLVPLPVALYAALEREAAEAGITVNELVITKLTQASSPLGRAG
jgi:hypothetical protein